MENQKNVRPQEARGKHLQKIFIALLILAVIYFFISRFTEMEKMIEVLKQAKPLWLGLALLVEAAWLVNGGFAWKKVYDLVGIKEDFKHLFLLNPVANYFINMIAPTMGMSALVMYMADAKRRNHSRAKTTVAFLIYFLFDYIGLLAVVMLAIIVLVRRHQLNWAEITAASILAVFALVIMVLLFMGMSWPRQLGKLFSWFARIGIWFSRKFKREPKYTEETAYDFAEEISEGVTVLRTNPKGVILPAILAVVNKGLLILILYLMFLAFQIPATLGTVEAGFAIGYLFIIVSPTPGGVGIVEGVMTVTLHSLRVELEAATIITLGFRALTYWIPFFMGLLLFRTVTRAKQLPEEKHGINSSN